MRYITKFGTWQNVKKDLSALKLENVAFFIRLKMCVKQTTWYNPSSMLTLVYSSINLQEIDTEESPQLSKLVSVTRNNTVRL